MYHLFRSIAIILYLTIAIFLFFPSPVFGQIALTTSISSSISTYLTRPIFTKKESKENIAVIGNFSTSPIKSTIKENVPTINEHGSKKIVMPQDTVLIIVNCIEETRNSITFGWNPTTGVSYEVNIDKQGWTSPSGLGAHSVNNLEQDQTVLLEIRGVKDTIFQVGQVSCKTIKTTDCNPPDVRIENIIHDGCHEYENEEGGSIELFTINQDVIFIINEDTFFSSYLFDLAAGIYSITAMDTISNCTINLEAEIEQTDPIVLDIFQTKTRCGEGNAMASVTTSGGVGSYFLYWSTGESTDTIKDLGSGNYELYVEDERGCSANQIFSIQEDNSTLTKGLTMVCKEITPSIITVSWSPVEEVIFYEVKIGKRKWREPTAATSITIPNTGSEIQIKVRSTKGCFTLLDSITSCTTVECLLSSTEFDAYNGYCHNYTDGEIIINNQDPNVIYLLNQDTFYSNYFGGLSPGKYAITLIDTLVGCNTIIETELTNPPPFVVKTYTKPETCGNKDGEAAVNISGGIAPYSIFWNNGDGEEKDTITNLAVGDYYVHIIDDSGCATERTLPVGLNVGTLKNVSIDIQCVVSTSNKIEISWDKITEVVDYEVRIDYGPWQAIDDTQSYEFTNLGSSAFYEIELKGISSCGEEIIGTQLCRTTSCKLPVFDVQLSKDNSCITGNLNRDIIVTLNTSGAPVLDTVDLCLTEIDKRNTYDFTCNEIHTIIPPTVGYVILDSDTFKVTKENPEVSFKELPSGFYSVELTDTNFTCVDYVYYDIGNTNNLEILQISGGTISCPNADDAIVQIIVDGGTLPYTYNWDGKVQSRDTYLNIGPGTYSVAVTDANGCSVSEEYIIEPPVPVTQEIYQEDDNCEEVNTGVVGLLIDEVYDSYTTTWNTGAKTDTISNLMAGNYTAIIQTKVGCRDTLNVSIEKTDIPDIEVSYTTQNASCNNISDGRSEAMITRETASYQYEWSTGAITPSVDSLAPGEYFLTITDQQGCKKIDTIEITQLGSLTGSFSKSNISCEGEMDGTIEINIYGGSGSYEYKIDDNTYTQDSIFTNLGPNTYIVKVRDSQGCELEMVDINIEEPNAISIQIEESQNTIQPGHSMKLQTEVLKGQGILNYTWSSDNDMASLSCLSCPNPEIKPLTTQQYLVTVIDEQGCEATSTFDISVAKNKSIYVPSAFSPNGDGINDILMIYGKEGTMVLSFRVFNRWGEKIFEQNNFEVNDLSSGWNGKYRNQILGTNVFSWMAAIEYADGTEELVSDYVTLVK